MEKRQSELTALFKRLYEDNVLGRITDEQFRLLSKDYTKEQSEIAEELPTMKERLQKLKGSAANVSRFLENARKYTEINELTCEILHIFIQRIEVGERSKRYSRSAAQEIRIYYRDIGLIDEMPETMLENGAEQETATFVPAVCQAMLTGEPASKPSPVKPMITETSTAEKEMPTQIDVA